MADFAKTPPCIYNASEGNIFSVFKDAQQSLYPRKTTKQSA